MWNSLNGTVATLGEGMQSESNRRWSNFNYETYDSEPRYVSVTPLSSSNSEIFKSKHSRETRFVEEIIISRTNPAGWATVLIKTRRVRASIFAMVLPDKQRHGKRIIDFKVLVYFATRDSLAHLHLRETVARTISSARHFPPFCGGQERKRVRKRGESSLVMRP